MGPITGGNPALCNRCGSFHYDMPLPTRTYIGMSPVWSMNGAYLPNNDCSETSLRSLSMKCDVQRVELCTRDVEHKYGSVKRNDSCFMDEGQTSPFYIFEG